MHNFKTKKFANFYLTLTRCITIIDKCDNVWYNQIKFFTLFVRSLLPQGRTFYIPGTVRLDLRYSFACSGGRGRRLPVAIVLRLTESADESPPLQIFAYIPFGCRGRRPRRPVRCSANIFNWCKQVKKLLSCVMAWKWQDLYHAIKPFRLFMILWWVYWKNYF